MFGDLEGEAKHIIDNIIELTWYMRGSIQYRDMMNMTYFERGRVRKFLDKRFESMRRHKNIHPVY